MGKNLFIVKFAVELWFTAIKGKVPWLAPFLTFAQPVLAYFSERFLGSLVDWGIVVIDLTVASVRVALEREEYRELAMKAYKNATARVYTEEEKRAIREEYLRVIRRFGRVGNGGVRT